MKKEITDKLLTASSIKLLNTIKVLVKERDNKDINGEYALEKFENYINRFDLRVSETEFDFLLKLRVKMYDNNGLLPKEVVKEHKSDVIVVDFKNKIKIKP